MGKARKPIGIERTSHGAGVRQSKLESEGTVGKVSEGQEVKGQMTKVNNLVMCLVSFI